MSKNSLNGLLGGFTHARIIDVDDVIANANTGDTASTISAFGIPAGAVVKDVALSLVTAFAGGANTRVHINAGDGTNPDGFVVQQDYFGGGDTGTSFNSGAYFVGTDNNVESGGDTTSNVVNGKTYFGADTLDVVITPDSAVSTLTAGKFIVCANIMNPQAYA